uniref:SRCR domain-containing protein n=1 Tax=Aquila chrysaetos chrysaetos TaxID=223781 RepID=A0A663F9W9_AQUCH
MESCSVWGMNPTSSPAAEGPPGTSPAPTRTVRLVDGGRRCAGRLEVKHNGEWGTVCSDYWSMNNSAVVCKQLGCGSAVGAPQGGHFGPGSGPIWMDDVGCKGTESALSDCEHRGWGEHNCDHSKDAGVLCFFPGFVRLVEGKSRCSGRVEIHEGDQWKTVCDSHFSPKAADVVCRELQCGVALPVAGPAHFGEGVSPIWDGELQCVGNESRLISCGRGSSRDQPCTHANSAVVTCTRKDSGRGVEHQGFRLVNGSTACAGRVEVQVSGTWGTLCASRWDLSDAHVLCRQLNCGFAESIPGGQHFGRGTGPVWRDSFHCDGTEAHLGQCPVITLGASSCSHGNNAAVVCSEGPGLALTSHQQKAQSCSAGFASLRLVGGGSRVEIYYQGMWGTVCDDGWDLSDAAVVCHQLGCGGAVEAAGSAHFGEGSGQIWLDGVNCSGAEAALWDCPARPWGQHDCGHKEDAGLPYGRVSGPTWLDYVQCGEKTSSFWQCPSAPWNPWSCEDLREETHITCNGNSEPPGHPSVTPAPVPCWVWPNAEKELGGAFPFHVSPFCCWWQRSDHSHTPPAAVATQVASSAWGRQRHLQVRSQKIPDRVQKNLPSIHTLLLLC